MREIQLMKHAYEPVGSDVQYTDTDALCSYGEQVESPLTRSRTLGSVTALNHELERCSSSSILSLVRPFDVLREETDTGVQIKYMSTEFIERICTFTDRDGDQQPEPAPILGVHGISGDTHEFFNSFLVYVSSRPSYLKVPTEDALQYTQSFRASGF